MLNKICLFVQDTIMRRAIPPHERLLSTLRFLASGMSYERLKFPTGISAHSLGKLFPRPVQLYALHLKTT